MDEDILIDAIEYTEEENEEIDDEYNEDILEELNKEKYYKSCENFLETTQRYCEENFLDINLFYGKENIYDFLEYIQNKYKK